MHTMSGFFFFFALSSSLNLKVSGTQKDDADLVCVFTCKWRSGLVLSGRVAKAQRAAGWRGSGQMLT